MEAVIIYRLPEKGAQIDSLFLAVDCSNSSRFQSTITLRIDFLFSFSHRSFEALSVSAVHLSISRPSVRLFGHFFRVIFTSSVIYFLSFHIIRDIFSPISHLISLLHCLHCLSIILPQITIPFFYSF